MKVCIMDGANTIEINVNSNDFIKELYDVLKQPSATELYFRNTLLEQQYPISHYFPYEIPKIYLYTYPYVDPLDENINEHLSTKSSLKTAILAIDSYLVLLLVIYMLFYKNV